MIQAPELAADYYLHNFLHLLDFVADRYWPLLPPAEQAFYRRFKQLPANAQQLYIRLLSRNGDYFLLGKLRYPEIGPLMAAVDSLSQARLIDANPAIILNDLLALFTKAELTTRLRSLLPAMRANCPRAKLVDQILCCEDSARLEIGQQLSAGETIVQPLDTASFLCFQLCFFGNVRQDLTDYVLRDLGVAQYENYSLDTQHAPFHSRQQLAQHLAYYGLVATLDDTLQQDASSLVALWRQLPVPEQGDTTLQRRVQRTTNTLARQLERLGAPNEALTLYQHNQRPPARERRARLLIQLGDIDAGLQLCRTMADTPRNEEEQVFAQQFGSRHARKHGIEWPAPARYRPPESQINLATSEHCVELAAAQHYAILGDCFYVENSLFNGVLGLFIWDILFAPIKGAFFNPFQSAPADYREHSFVSSRQRLFDQRFAELDDSQALRKRVIRNWQQKYGLANPLVHWERLSPALVELALERIPEHHWRCLFKRLISDLHHNRSGLPDLILFPERGSYQLIEIKAPGDRLQKNQQRWMQFFANHDIPHGVAHVSWLPA